MTKDQELVLRAWYHRQARSLPWRQNRELYPVLVSEMMLQQTTVAAVIPKFASWMERFPTLAALASAPEEAVMEAWSGLGYYSRARRLHRVARLLDETTSPPQTFEELRRLPGLGPYTAAAVASIAWGQPHLALDTNALRVLLRLKGWPVRADLEAVRRRLRQDVEQALLGESSSPDLDFGITNQALMELGAVVCRVRDPECGACPLQNTCQARFLGLQQAIPIAKPRKPLRVTPVKAFFVSEGDGVYLVQGTPVGLLETLFQPPLDFGSDNRLGPLGQLLGWLRAFESEPVGCLAYAISGRRLEIALYRSRLLGSELEREATRRGVVWHLQRDGQALPMSSLSRRLLKAWRENR